MAKNNTIQTVDKKGQALTSLILGLISIIAWIIPILGLPASIVGLVMGIIGRKSSRRGMAIAGIILSSIFIIVSIANAALGAYLFTKVLQTQ